MPRPTFPPSWAEASCLPRTPSLLESHPLNPGDASVGSTATRLQLLLAFGLSLLVALPFVQKPVHQDDWAYLRVAELVREAPADVLAEVTIYQGMPISAGEGVLHGPVWIHGLAFSLGFGEQGLLVAHVLSALCLALLGLSCASLAGRLGAPPLVSALLVTLSPVPLVLAGNLMTDLPMLAFFAASLALGARGVERGSKLALVGAGLCAALASLTRYHGMAILPMLLAFFVLWPRHRFAPAWRVGRAQLLALLPFLIGTLLVVAFLVRTALLKGEADSARAVGALEALANIDREACLLAALAAVGGTVLGLTAGWFGAPRRLVAAFRSRGALGVLVGGLFVGILASVVAEARAGVLPTGVNLGLQRVLFVLAGLTLLTALRIVWRGDERAMGNDVVPGLRGWRERHGKELLLLFWLAGFLVAAWVTVPFGSTRYALPALPAATLFLALFTGRALGARALWIGLVPTALLGFGSAVADLHAAQVYPEFAKRVAERSAPGGPLADADLWIWGELDFRWYLEEEPGLAATNQGGPPRVLERSSDAPRPGDQIFKSAICTASSDGRSGTYQLSPSLVQRMKSESVEAFEDAWPVRIHNSYVAAGFYGAAGGLLPFAWAGDDSPDSSGTVPHDRIQTWGLVDANPFFTSFDRARLETTQAVSLPGGNIRIEPFLVSHGVDLGIEMKPAVSIIFPGSATWEGVPIGTDISKLELLVAEHDRTAELEGPGAIVRVRINGRVATELTLDSRRDPSQRRWIPLAIDLTSFRGQSVSITFEASEGPWPGKPAESTGPPPLSVGFAQPKLH